MRAALQRAQLIVIAVAVVLGAVACPPGVSVLSSAKPDAEAGHESAGYNPSPDSLGGPYGHPKTGKWKKNVPTVAAPVNLVTGVISDADLAKYLDTLNFDKQRDNGELALVSCDSPTPGCSVKLYIQPEIGMTDRGHANVPQTGMVVARVINYSTADSDVTYKIPPLSRAYWYVYPAGNSPRSRVFTRVPGASPPLRWLGAVIDTTYSECSHKHGAGPAQAKLRNCVEYISSRTRGDAVSGPPNPFIRPVSSRPMRLMADNSLTATELWVKCDQGCCVAGTALYAQ